MTPPKDTAKDTAKKTVKKTAEKALQKAAELVVPRQEMQPEARATEPGTTEPATTVATDRPALALGELDVHLIHEGRPGRLRAS